MAKLSEELGEMKKKYLAEKKTNRTLRMFCETSRETPPRTSIAAGETLSLMVTGIDTQSLKSRRSSCKPLSSFQRSTIIEGPTQPDMKMSKVKLEVCVDNLDSALAAINGGADRLELCSSLIDGGLTPTPGLLFQIHHINSRNIPVFCLLRCRPGNFIYTTEEIEIMKEDAKVLRKNGADGFVFGALSENGNVDMKVCRDIVRMCHPLPVTFHRAFDFCKRPTIEVEVIIDLGFQRILTSGKQQNAQLGVKLIKKLIEQVGNRITIMPGGGITKDNLKCILENCEPTEIHGSFKVPKNEPEKSEEDSAAVIGEREGPLYVTDENLVAEVVNILKNA